MGPELKPASMQTEMTYDPQGSGMDHDSVFRMVAGGIADSGNMAHKWMVPDDHWCPDEPPSDMKGD